VPRSVGGVGTESRSGSERLWCAGLSRARARVPGGGVRARLKVRYAPSWYSWISPPRRSRRRTRSRSISSAMVCSSPGGSETSGGRCASARCGGARVVRDIRGEDVLEVAAGKDEDPVEAFAADRADPALSVRPSFRRPHGRLDHLDALRAEDLVEVTGELAVSITDEEPRAHILVVEPHQQVARLLGHPPPVRIRRDPREPNAASGDLDEEQDIEPLQEERVDGKKIVFEDARRLLPEKLDPARLHPLRRRLDARLLEDRPDGAGGEPDAETA
jgi:hypothetical protein